MDIEKKSTDLPLYTATYRVLEQVDYMLNTYKRDRRHTLGQKIYNTTLELFDCLQEAVDFPELREQALRRYIGHFTTLKTLLKLSNEHGYMEQTHYLALAKPIASIERQSNGWLRKTIEENKAGAGSIDYRESVID